MHFVVLIMVMELELGSGLARPEQTGKRYADPFLYHSHIFSLVGAVPSFFHSSPPLGEEQFPYADVEICKDLYPSLFAD